MGVHPFELCEDEGVVEVLHVDVRVLEGLVEGFDAGSDIDVMDGD